MPLTLMLLMVVLPTTQLPAAVALASPFTLHRGSDRFFDGEGRGVVGSPEAHADGLAAKDGPLHGFTIAGADKKFVPAQAEIANHLVIVWSDEVSAPVAVRYRWTNVPDVNLVNGGRLPASPFRTEVD